MSAQEWLESFNALPRLTNADQAKMLRRLINRLAMKPVRTCRWMHECILCGKKIRDGQEYRDAGVSARSHTNCYDAVSTMLKEIGK